MLPPPHTHLARSVEDPGSPELPMLARRYHGMWNGILHVPSVQTIYPLGALSETCTTYLAAAPVPASIIPVRLCQTDTDTSLKRPVTSRGPHSLARSQKRALDSNEHRPFLCWRISSAIDSCRRCSLSLSLCLPVCPPVSLTGRPKCTGAGVTLLQ
ncbi:hypothetical protein LX36DRAFT_257295 [Colletotrichum falcatum]|nr:hypothetical protein LX36DRAFT_257295 [Colletotrichum falcatum]